MRGIIWLASYPKSGNTWFRIFLENLLGDQRRLLEINELDGTAIASARGIFDDNVGIEASDLDFDEIERLRPDVYLKLAELSEEALYMKVHDAYTSVEEERFLFPVESTAGVIYLIRNPLDVAVSFAYHLGIDYDRAIMNMADEGYTFCGTEERLYSQLRQRLLSWSSHVLSWTQSGIRTHIIRYEDMKLEPYKTFEGAVRFLGLKYEKERINRAIVSSAFKRLQQQEKESGFKEKSPNAELFFRNGESGSWRGELTGEQAERIIKAHREVMIRFGYLDNKGDVIY
jgi:hypothetical protein